MASFRNPASNRPPATLRTPHHSELRRYTMYNCRQNSRVKRLRPVSVPRERAVRPTDSGREVDLIQRRSPLARNHLRTAEVLSKLPISRELGSYLIRNDERAGFL